MEQTNRAAKINRTTRCAVCYAALLLLTLALGAAGLRFGSVKITAQEIISALGGEKSTAADIIMISRLPRVIAATVLGGALAVSGYLLQTFFANPIAGPFVLGISSGAKLTVALAMIVFLGNGMTLDSAGLIIAAFVGSLLSLGLIIPVSGRAQKNYMLIVCGIMIGYICSAVTEFVVTFADDSNIVNLHNWSMGSFSGIGMDEAGVMSAVVLAAMVPTFLLSKQIGARGGVRAQFRREYPVVQAGGDTAVEPALRLRYGVRGASVLRGDCGSACREANARHRKSACDNPGGVPRRSLLLPAVRPHRADALRAD